MTDVSVARSAKPAGPFSAWEFELALRYLRARRKEGGIALIAIISYVAISLAVMALIVVMSIMAGFRSELLSRMLSFNGHMYVQGQVLSDPNRDAMVARLQKTPGVVSVTPVTENQSLVRAAGQTTGADHAAPHRQLRPVCEWQDELGLWQQARADLPPKDSRKR